MNIRAKPEDNVLLLKEEEALQGEITDKNAKRML